MLRVLVLVRQRERWVQQGPLPVTLVYKHRSTPCHPGNPQWASVEKAHSPEPRMGTFQQIKGQEPTDSLMNLEKKKKDWKNELYTEVGLVSLETNQATISIIWILKTGCFQKLPSLNYIIPSFPFWKLSIHEIRDVLYAIWENMHFSSILAIIWNLDSSVWKHT